MSVLYAASTVHVASDIVASYLKVDVRERKCIHVLVNMMTSIVVDVNCEIDRKVVSGLFFSLTWSEVIQFFWVSPVLKVQIKVNDFL